MEPQGTVSGVEFVTLLDNARWQCTRVCNIKRSHLKFFSFQSLQCCAGVPPRMSVAKKRRRVSACKG